MPIREELKNSLLRCAVQVSASVSDSHAASFRDIAGRAVEEIGLLTGVSHVHLLVIRRARGLENTGSVLAEWSGAAIPSVGPQLQNVPLRFLGTETLKCLRAGQPYFTEFDHRKNACSKLMSGLLRELGVSGCHLLPVLSNDQLTAVASLAHDGGTQFLSEETIDLVRLICGSLVQAVHFSGRERRRRRMHRQWKSVANGACDFALQVNDRMEISKVIAFRQARPPQVEGLLLEEFLAYSARDSVLDLIQSAIRDSAPRSLQFLAINADGRPCSYAGRIEVSVPITRNCALTLYLTNNDTERAHAEELDGLRRQLDRAARLSLLGNIATEFAHQLTQPLQAVSNHLFTLTSRVRKGEAVDRILPCVKSIETSVDHAAAIIRSLREFVTNRRMSLAPVQVSTLVHHAVSMVEVQSERAGVKVHVDDSYGLLDLDSSPFIMADAVQTTHVIINLLVNSIEAMNDAVPDDPEIRISASIQEAAGKITVSVTDNGPGLSKEDPESVFERFFTTKKEGFGIGLAICRDVIERQDGTIHAANNPDQGCRFYFTLPLCTDADLAEYRQGEEEEPLSLESDTTELHD